MFYYLYLKFLHTERKLGLYVNGRLRALDARDDGSNPSNPVGSEGDWKATHPYKWGDVGSIPTISLDQKNSYPAS